MWLASLIICVVASKVTVNKDMSRDQMIQSLRAEVASLRKQLQAVKGVSFDDDDDDAVVSDDDDN